MKRPNIIKIPRSYIAQIVSSIEGIDSSIKDEMSIPSYLHPNFLIRWIMWKRYEFIALLAQFNKSMTVFELGCGLGLFLPTLYNSVGFVLANDVFPEYAKKLSQRLNLDVKFVNKIEELSDQTLDIIIAADVMEHLESPEYYCSIFWRKLKKNGRLIVSGPTENYIYKIGRIVAGFHKKGCFHKSNIEDLKVIIEENNFNFSRMLTLPFIFPPFFFKIIEFFKMDHEQIP